jgi:hypothetical protein
VPADQRGKCRLVARFCEPRYQFGIANVVGCLTRDGDLDAAKQCVVSGSSHR